MATESKDPELYISSYIYNAEGMAAGQNAMLCGFFVSEITKQMFDKMLAFLEFLCYNIKNKHMFAEVMIC